jgi:hypothetical protein
MEGVWVIDSSPFGIVNQSTADVKITAALDCGKTVEYVAIPLMP